MNGPRFPRLGFPLRVANVVWDVPQAAYGKLSYRTTVSPVRRGWSMVDREGGCGFPPTVRSTCEAATGFSRTVSDE